MARDNTVHYQWRVLQLLPGAERPSYAGLRVEVLARADGELIIRYQGETVEFQEGEPPASARWGEGTGLFPGLEQSVVADDQAAGRLDVTQRKLLADLESSVEGRAKAKKAADEARPVQQAKSRGLSLRAIARELGMSRVATSKYALAGSPPTKLLSAKERAKAEALLVPESQMAAD